LTRDGGLDVAHDSQIAAHIASGGRTVSMSGMRLTERTMAGQRGYATGRVLGWLFRRSQEMADAKDYDLQNALDLQRRAAWAIIGPQSELFPFQKRRLPAFQLRFPGL
jgi:hypothetical protein